MTKKWVGPRITGTHIQVLLLFGDFEIQLHVMCTCMHLASFPGPCPASRPHSYCMRVSSALCLYSPSDVTVGFTTTSYNVSESGRFVNLSVVREGLTSQTVSVILNTTDDTALGEKSSHCRIIYNQTFFLGQNLVL